MQVLRDGYGNPSSRHTLGRQAAALVQKATEQIMDALGVKQGALIFTSGGTEANNLAILGRAEAKPRLQGGTILTTQGEHASVEAPLAYLQQKGYSIAYLPTKEGVLDFSVAESFAAKKMLLATAMTVNNETGAVYDIKALSQYVHQHFPDALVHTDATQGFLKVDCSPQNTKVDMLTLSGHKIGAPKGIGALWISPDVIKTRGLLPRNIGGGQCQDLRSGTENVPGIVALGVACEVGKKQQKEKNEKMAQFRLSLLEELQNDARFRAVTVLTPKHPAPHILSLAIPGLPAETLLNFLSQKGICVSAGSACASNHHQSKASAALLAYGVPEKTALSTIRLSFDGTETQQDKERFLSLLSDALTFLYRRR